MDSFNGNINESISKMALIKRKSVAIIGSGISGIVSAYSLYKQFNVILFESESQLGGHTFSMPVSDPNLGQINIDMGFIVFNLINYPLFAKFLKDLNVNYQDSDMSFGFYDKQKDFFYNSDFPNGTFSKRRHFFSVKFWRFLNEIRLFNKHVMNDLNTNQLGSFTVLEYLSRLPFSNLLINAYVLPMGAAIWSCPKEQINDFPAAPFFKFWKNHHLLTLGNRPVWKTVQGGSQSYINAFKKIFNGEIRLNEKVTKIIREPNKVKILTNKKQSVEVDFVIVATHADQALTMIHQPSNIESDLLGAWKYSKNSVCLHTDQSSMPPKRNVWSSWLVNQSSDDLLEMNYYMNRLQNLQSSVDYFVSLNNNSNINSGKKIMTKFFTHPIFNAASIKTQSQLNELNTGPLFFCGSYFGNGFHEDGVRSAIQAVNQLNKTYD